MCERTNVTEEYTLYFLYDFDILAPDFDSSLTFSLFQPLFRFQNVLESLIDRNSWLENYFKNHKILYKIIL